MGREISFGEFLDAVIQLRGSNKATVKDLVNLRNFISKQLAHVEIKTLTHVEHHVERSMSRKFGSLGVGSKILSSERITERTSQGSRQSGQSTRQTVTDSAYSSEEAPKISGLRFVSDSALSDY